MLVLNALTCLLDQIILVAPGKSRRIPLHSGQRLHACAGHSGWSPPLSEIVLEHPFSCLSQLDFSVFWDFSEIISQMVRYWKIIMIFLKNNYNIFGNFTNWVELEKYSFQEDEFRAVVDKVGLDVIRWWYHTFIVNRNPIL